MAKGSQIVLPSNPRGMFLEGTISGAPQPGVLMEIKNGAFKNGRPIWQAWSKASGAFGLIAVLLAPKMKGDLEVGTAQTFGPPHPVVSPYADGDHCFLYAPFRGEELNVLTGDIAGTGDSVAIGDLFGVTTVTGKLIANSAYAYPCFTAMEAVTNPTADFMLWVTFNG